jgi:hypothetical protein
METITLSEAALSLLRRRLVGERIAVTEENRPLFRDLVAAGLMEPLSTFLHGKEGNYRPTEAAFELRDTGRLTSPCNPSPVPAVTLAPRG